MNRLFPILLLSGLAACGTDVSGPSAALFSCAFDAPSTLSVGEVIQTRGQENTLCIGASGAEPADFAYIPFFGATPPADDDESDVSLAFELQALGAGVRPASASASTHPPLPHDSQDRVVLLEGAAGPGGAVAPGGSPARDTEFHDWLRRREIEELTPLIRPGPSALRSGLRGDTRVAGVTVPQVGDLRTYNVSISCSEEDLRTGRVMHVSEHAIVVADTANPAAGLTPQDYAYFGVTFDTLVYPVETAHFGVPADIDDNGRAILFFTRAVNERNPSGSRVVTIGFFWSGDLFPEEASGRLEACPAGNDAEMFYLLAPDPGGVAGREFSLEDVRRLAIPLIGHEFQHLVNASRRLFVNDAVTFEDPWLNEGLSHAAEELLFFEAAGLEPARNLTEEDIRAAPNGVSAFNEYMAGNLSNFNRYLSAPDTASLMGPDLLATRGAAWAFLRYAADRTQRGDEAFFFDLVNSRVAGLDNLGEVLGADTPLDWMRDWTVAVYADDFVPGVAERFTLPSWDLRSVYAGTTVGSYPLEVLQLSDDPRSVELIPGGTVYTRFGVDAGEQAVVHVNAGGVPLPASLRGSLIRVR